jgi:predicted O-methyltransferase YrrM
MISSGMEDRMTGIKGDSHKLLMDMVLGKNENFDLIYVDGSHSSIDTYMDCYLYNLEDNSISILNIKQDRNLINHSPYDGINNFLEKHKNEYKILNIL